MLFLFSCVSEKLIYEGQSINSFHKVLLENEAEDITNSIGTLFQETEFQHRYYQLKNDKIILVWYNKNTLEMGNYISITKIARETTKGASWQKIVHMNLLNEIQKEEKQNKRVN